MATNGNGNGNGIKNGVNEFIDNDGFTKLDWDEYRKKADKIWNSIPAGQPKKKIVEEALGVGRWPDKNGNLITYILKSNKDRKENFQRQPVKTRIKNQKNFVNTRKNNLNAVNEFVPDDELKAGKTLQKNIQNIAGRNADHIVEVQTFGPAMEQLTKEWKAGAITKAEYTKRLNILKNTGDSVNNFQDLSIVDNQAKKDIVQAKNKTLQKMEELNPSTRHLDDKYVKAMSLADGYKVTKTARPIKRLLKWVPYVGTGIVALNLKAQADELKEENSWQNRWQLGIASVESALEGFELATGGTGALITTPLQIGLMIAHEGIEASKPGHVKPDNDETVKKQTEGQKYDFTTM